MSSLRRWLAPLVACALGACGGGGSDSGAGSVEFTASGEVLALGGYAFPPAMEGDADFVDGWQVQFTKFIAVFDKVTLSQNPDEAPGNQSLTGSCSTTEMASCAKVVAEIDGPWAVDLHQGGPLPGKGGSGEEAVPIETISDQNMNGGAGFDPTVRYAFGFESVAATADAKLVGIATGDTDYADMVTNGWNVLYVGTATYKGGASCTSTNPSYDFSVLPTTVNFRFGFATPTTYINCQNPDNDPAAPLGDEEHQRGVQIKENTTTYAQVTFHTDHPFWESFVHDSPTHFDQLAALAKKQTDGSYLVTLDDTTGVDYEAFKDQNGNALPWRACDPQYTPPNSSPQMGFDSLTVPYDPMGDPATMMRDYGDYMRYDQSTQGHLNSDGLCFVQRQYPSPN